jgi:ATP-dependent Clp protease ATP-binding subunit ClpA
MTWKAPLTDRAADALDCAIVALKFRRNALPTAELLRAIDDAGPSLARGMFTALEVNIADVIKRARLISCERSSDIARRKLQSRPASLDIVLRRAVEEAALLGHRNVGTEHLLLAMLSLHDDPTTCALRAAGVTQDTARGTLRRLLPAWTDDGRPRHRPQSYPGYASVA